MNINKLPLVFLGIFFISFNFFAQDFQGKAIYFSKSTMDLGRFGARMSETQKKQIQERLKNRLEKTYVLTFNKYESTFEEDDKLDAMSGATDSWGKNFTPGDHYKNIKDNKLVQDQEFYGKKFLVKDRLPEFKWVMGNETKQIGNYTCFKATTSIPTSELEWYNFSWDEIRANEQMASDSSDTDMPEIAMTTIEAWYSPQIPISNGPMEYWGLPGLILEVSAGNTTMLCSKIVINPDEKEIIEAPTRGQEITKKEYKNTIIEKMKEFRENRMGRRGR